MLLIKELANSSSPFPKPTTPVSITDSISTKLSILRPLIGNPLAMLELRDSNNLEGSHASPMTNYYGRLPKEPPQAESLSKPLNGLPPHWIVSANERCCSEKLLSTSTRKMDTRVSLLTLLKALAQAATLVSRLMRRMFPRKSINVFTVRPMHTFRDSSATNPERLCVFFTLDSTNAVVPQSNSDTPEITILSTTVERKKPSPPCIKRLQIRPTCRKSGRKRSKSSLKKMQLLL